MHPSVRVDIWILLSDTISQTQLKHLQRVRQQCCLWNSIIRPLCQWYQMYLDIPWKAPFEKRNDKGRIERWTLSNATITLLGSPTGASGLGYQTTMTRLTLVISQVLFGVVDDSKDNDQDVVEEPAPSQLDLAHHGLLEQLARRHHHRLPPGQPHQVHLHVVSGNRRLFFPISPITRCSTKTNYSSPH